MKYEPKESMPYDELRDSLKTGDILLFSGEGLVSWIIKVVTCSHKTHGAMIYRPGNEGEINQYLFAETDTDEPDKERVAQLLNKIQLIIPKDNQEKSLNELWVGNKQEILEVLKKSLIH